MSNIMIFSKDYNQYVSYASRNAYGTECSLWKRVHEVPWYLVNFKVVDHKVYRSDGWPTDYTFYNGRLYKPAGFVKRWPNKDFYKTFGW